MKDSTYFRTVLELWQIGVKVMLKWCESGDRVVLDGVRVVLEWC
jgi:hypothetical protein